METSLQKMIEYYLDQGYSQAYASARVCQDVLIKAISSSSLNRNVTIKGGVIMRSLSGSIRRATEDLDLDFVRYSLSNDSIERFVQKINVIDKINIRRIKKIEELKHQEYHGKRIYLSISDDNGTTISTKLDLGVHKNMHIDQMDYCFDVCMESDGVCLLANTSEQIFTEKLRSLLKFGTYSTRHKDLYDMAFLTKNISYDKLNTCLHTYIYDDPGMKENSIADILRRLTRVLSDKSFLASLDNPDVNWLDGDVKETVTTLLQYFHNIG